MAGFKQDELYREHREAVLRVATQLETTFRTNHVFFAGRKINSIKDFDDPSVALKTDLEMLVASRVYVLYYPDKRVSSVLVEAGIALALGIPSVYAVKKSSDLPFLLKEASNRYKWVRTIEFKDVDDLVARIERNGQELFDHQSQQSREV